MNIMDRILPVFKRNYPLEVRDDVWNYCMSEAMKVELNESNLENMCSTSLVSGFGGGPAKKEIVKLAEALGVCGISNPETEAFYKRRYPPKSNLDDLTPDQILEAIQNVFQSTILFPPFHGNCLQGLQTKYGVATNRNVYYLWILKRILELCPDKDTGIIEIGAGFGVLGYYLHGVGYNDYTTIDLALINACQTYFLAKNLPDRNIIISGEVQHPFDPQFKDSIKLLHSTDFKDIPKNRFGIMINVDGFTEMGLEHAARYVQSDCSKMLLSINHEVNPFRVCEIEQPLRKRQYRYLFWIRDGYVEELYVQKS